jgi:hypothetical protein
VYSYKIYNCNDACQLFVYNKIMIASSAPQGAEPTMLERPLRLLPEQSLRSLIISITSHGARTCDVRMTSRDYCHNSVSGVNADIEYATKYEDIRC